MEKQTMKMSIGGDHCGSLEGTIIEMLKEWGHEVTIMEPSTQTHRLSGRRPCGVRPGPPGRSDRGIMVWGTGVGASIAATRYRASAPRSATTSIARTSASSMMTPTCCASGLDLGIKTAEEVVRHFPRRPFRSRSDFVRRVAKLARWKNRRPASFSA